VRRGDPGGYLGEKTACAQLNIFSGDPETARSAEEAAIAAWRDRHAASPSGQAVLIARDNARRARLNALARAELQRQGRLGESVHVAGHEFAVGDRVIARRNDRLRAVDNGMRGTVIDVDPTEQELLVRTDAGGDRALDAPYVAEHLEHAYALSAHTIQGGTVDWAGVVGHPDDFTRNWSYTRSRAHATRPRSSSSIPQPSTNLSAPRSPQTTPRNWPTSARPLSACRPRCAAATMTTSPSTASTGSRNTPWPMSHCRPHAAALALETTRRGAPSTSCAPNSPSCASALPVAPTHLLTTQGLPRRARRGAAHRRRGEHADRRARAPDARDGSPRALRSGGTGLRTRAPRSRRTRNRESDRSRATARRRRSEPSGAGGEHKGLRERAATLEAELSILRQQHLHGPLEHSAPYLIAELGPPPEQPRARRTWQQAAHRIEAYLSITRSWTPMVPLAHDPPRPPCAPAGSEHNNSSTGLSANSAITPTVASGARSEFARDGRWAARADEPMRPAVDMAQSQPGSAEFSEPPPGMASPGSVGVHRSRGADRGRHRMPAWGRRRRCDPLRWMQ
jgi:hypothetical protein